jgi:hypothetical protein
MKFAPGKGDLERLQLSREADELQFKREMVCCSLIEPEASGYVLVLHINIFLPLLKRCFNNVPK